MGIPGIPEGLNTVSLFFTHPNGCHGLAIFQRGFAHVAKDDERQVNGGMVILLNDKLWNRADAEIILDGVMRNFVK